jgi:hypothetical protein
MRMFRTPRPGYCASCEGAITSRPVYRMDEAYCCAGCAEGGPCVCNYEADLADDGVDGLGLIAPVRRVAPERAPLDEPIGVGARR